MKSNTKQIWGVILMTLFIAVATLFAQDAPTNTVPVPNPNAEIPYLEQVLKWSEKLAGLPALPLIFVLCVALAALLKWLPFVSNRAIPIVIVGAGSIGNTLLVLFGGGNALTAARAFIIGLIAAVFAILAYLKFIRDKIPSFDTETFKRTPLILLCGLLALSPVTFIGCGTTPETTAYQVSKGASITVESAMAAWNDYVKAGRATLDQERAVKRAFEKYQACQVAVLDAAIVYARVKEAGAASSPERMNAAIAAAGPALADLISLLRTFNVKI